MVHSRPFPFSERPSVANSAHQMDSPAHHHSFGTGASRHEQGGTPGLDLRDHGKSSCGCGLKPSEGSRPDGVPTILRFWRGVQGIGVWTFSGAGDRRRSDISSCVSRLGRPKNRRAMPSYGQISLNPCMSVCGIGPLLHFRL